MMEERQQKVGKERNISVRDVVSHMSEGIFIKNIFLVSKWKEPLNLFGLFCWLKTSLTQEVNPWSSFKLLSGYACIPASVCNKQLSLWPSYS